jgi:hypothetical protein
MQMYLSIYVGIITYFEVNLKQRQTSTLSNLSEIGSKVRLSLGNPLIAFIESA